MKKIFTLFLVTFLISCGKVESSIEEFADQAQGMMNLTSTFDEEDIQGVWVTEKTFTYHELSDAQRDSLYFPIDYANRINPAELKIIEDRGKKECTHNTLENYIEIKLQYIMAFSGKNYQSLGYAKLTDDSGKTSHCILKFGESNYTTLGSYAYLVDRNESIYLETTGDHSTLIMGFTEL